jgi:hypothetical protein
LQHKEQTKDTLIAMSRKLEVVALQIANRGWNNFFVYLSRGLVARFAAFLHLLWTVLLNSVIIGYVHLRM